MKLSKEKRPPIKRVRIQVQEIEGNALIDSRSVSLYETNAKEVMAMILEAIEEVSKHSTLSRGHNGQ